MLLKIPGNFQEDSVECTGIFRRILLKIQGNIQEVSGEYSRRFQVVLLKILGSVQEDSGKSKFWFTPCNLACLSSKFIVKLLQNSDK